MEDDDKTVATPVPAPDTTEEAEEADEATTEEATPEETAPAEPEQV
jgi:hypothetical protein